MQKTVSGFAAWGMPKGSGMNLIKIAGMVMAFVLVEAQAAEPAVINLSCDGTMASSGDPTETTEPKFPNHFAKRTAKRSRSLALSSWQANRPPKHLPGSGIDQITGAELKFGRLRSHLSVPISQSNPDRMPGRYS